jgi:hypothetical protein
MAQKAIEGDVSAAKLILDRVYPARRQVDERGGLAPGGIVINITRDSGNGEDPAGSTANVITAEPANGKSTYRSQGCEIVALDGGEEG